MVILEKLIFAQVVSECPHFLQNPEIHSETLVSPRNDMTSHHRKQQSSWLPPREHNINFILQVGIYITEITCSFITLLECSLLHCYNAISRLLVVILRLSLHILNLQVVML
jgi:hypothetical protein